MWMNDQSAWRHELVFNIMFNVFPGQDANENNNVYNTSSCLEKPFRCPHPKIKFYLYTRRTQELGEEISVLNPESLWNSHWNPVHPVKVIIHGKLRLASLSHRFIWVQFEIFLRVWRRKKLNTKPGSSQSIFYGWWLQHHHRWLRRSGARAMSEPNWLVTEICQSLHCTTH